MSLLFPGLQQQRRKRRDPRDFYATAPWQVDALVDFLPELGGSVWCPCVGDGALLRRLLERRPDLGPTTTNDADPKREADFHLDATLHETWQRIYEQRGYPDWIVENPPFGAAFKILQHAYRFANVGVAFLSRVSFTEPTQERALWLSQHPYQRRISLPRHSFTGAGNDSASADWIIWSKVPLAPPFGIVVPDRGIDDRQGVLG